MLLVPSTAQYTVRGTYLGRDCDNTLAICRPEPGSLPRDEQVKVDAEAVLAAWSTDMRPCFTSSYTMKSVHYVDMSSTSGVTGEVSASTDPAVSWPLNGSGGGGGHPLPGNVSVMVTKATSRRRNERPGRFYFAPPGETWSNGNGLEPTGVTNIQTNADNFLTYLNGLIGATAFIAVVSKATATTGVARPITALIVSPTFATQRRRLRG